MKAETWNNIFNLSTIGVASAMVTFIIATSNGVFEENPSTLDLCGVFSCIFLAVYALTALCNGMSILIQKAVDLFKVPDKKKSFSNCIDEIKHHKDKSMLVIGAGPVGLAMALVALRKHFKVKVLESMQKSKVMRKSLQVSVDEETCKFLKTLGIDCNDMISSEQGCWHVPLFLLHQVMIQRCEEFGTSFSIDYDFGCKAIINNLVSEKGKMFDVIMVCDGQLGTDRGDLESSLMFGMEEMVEEHVTEMAGYMTCCNDALDEKPLDASKYQPVVTEPSHVMKEGASPLSEIHLDKITAIPCPPLGVRISGYPGHRHLSVFTKDAKLASTLYAMKEDCVIDLANKVLQSAMLKMQLSPLDTIDKKHFLPDKHEIKKIRVLSRKHTSTVLSNGTVVFVEGAAARKCNFSTGGNFNIALKGVKYYTTSTLLECYADHMEISKRDYFARKLHHELVEKVNKCSFI